MFILYRQILIQISNIWQTVTCITKKPSSATKRVESSNKKGKLSGAERAYKKAIKINQDFVEAHNNLGNVLIELDELDDAVANFNKAIEIEPGHIEAYNGLGNAQGYLGEIDKAIAAYRKAIEIDSRHYWKVDTRELIEIPSHQLWRSTER